MSVYRIIFFIPQSMYCSRKCRSKAHSSYHETECKMISFFERPYTHKDEQQALQIFLAGTKQGKDLRRLMGILSPNDVFEKRFLSSDAVPENDYLTLMKLCPTYNDESLTLMLNGILPYVVAIVITLQDISFFTQTEDPTPVS